eukprot:3546323-Ditylum_brightwellii.AAC.1
MPKNISTSMKTNTAVATDERRRTLCWGKHLPLKPSTFSKQILAVPIAMTEPVMTGLSPLYSS